MKLTKIDSISVNDVLAEIKKIKNNAAITDKFIELELEDTDGDESEAIRLVTELHKDPSVYTKINCKGDIKIAGTLIAVAGKPSFRKSNAKATFELASLNIKDRDSVYDILTALSGKSKSLAKELKNTNPRQKLDAQEGVELGIIDEISRFQSIFKTSKMKNNNKNNKNTSTV